MPSAADVVADDRLRFALDARPDLLEPLRAALRPELGDDVEARLETLGRDEPSTLGALQPVNVAGYYTDRRVRELIGYKTGRGKQPGSYPSDPNGKIDASGHCS